MKNTIKLTITVFTLVLLIISGCATQIQQNKSNTSPLTFGAILPLSGTNAFYGNFAKAGISLAIEDLNNAGGVDGRMIKVIYEDGPDKASATTAAKKLVEIDNVDALFAMLTPTAAATVPIAEESKTPLIYWSPSTSFSAGKQFVFQDYFDAAGTCKLLMQQAKTLGQTKIAIFGVNAEVTQLCKQGAESIAPPNSYELYNVGESDFRTQFTKIKENGAEGIILSVFAPDCNNAYKQIRELDIKPQLFLPFSSTACGSKENTKSNLDILSTAYASDWDIDEDSQEPAIATMRQRLNENGGTTQLAGSIITYDSIKTMANAYAGCADKECASEKLRSTHGFAGTTGPISYDGKQIVTRGLMLTKYENGKWNKVN